MDNHHYDSPEGIAFAIDVGRAEYLACNTRATRSPFARSSSAPAGARDRRGSSRLIMRRAAPSV